jgi:hypothetical protein
MREQANSVLQTLASSSDFRLALFLTNTFDAMLLSLSSEEVL